MSIALIQKASVAASGSTSQSGAYASNNTLGNFLVATVWIDSGMTLSSMTDTAGNTWAQATSIVVGGITAYLMYAANCKSGANTVTVTGSGPSSFPNLFWPNTLASPKVLHWIKLRRARIQEPLLVLALHPRRLKRVSF